VAPWTQTATYINILLGLNNDFKTTLDNQNLHQLQAKAQAKLWTGCRKQDSIVSIHPKQQGKVNTGHDNEEDIHLYQLAFIHFSQQN